MTVTGDDSDDMSLYSDYISPNPYIANAIRAAAAAGRPFQSTGGVDAMDDSLRVIDASVMANVGDDISLFGTPKEELSPFRELEAAAAAVHSRSNSTSNYLRDQIVSFFQPSDNKLAMKLFGNKNALMKEKLRQKAAGNWVIHPCSNFRYVCSLVFINIII